MPRGESNETPEVPQEGRDTSPEVKQETERLEQASAQPESVVEMERPVKESEEIEKELAAAVEAVPNQLIQ